MDAQSFLYFAYGSNMPSLRLSRRTPSARSLGPAWIEGYRLEFRKRGQDGSAKCDLVEAAEPGARVFGVLYTIDQRERTALDEQEGCPEHYRAEQAAVRTYSGAVWALAYRAQPGHHASGLLPYDWYHALVLAGAREHGLPESYCARIEQWRTMPDPQPERAARAQALLNEIAAMRPQHR
jgi:gamma-glutamylcyclotransferase (GGCT)/AIG2-like uncharacterized protein YtfP